MTTVKTLATHEIVQLEFPRADSVRDEVAKAAGNAIDGVLSRAGYEFQERRKATATSMKTLAATILDDELADADVALPVAEREAILVQVSEVLRAFRKSELMGLPRPRTRVILINERVGVYAQPDYWDRKSRFYEMKSYLALPPRPDVALQLKLFQLAFAPLQAFLACFDRHANPVQATIVEIPPLSSAETQEVLGLALRLGLEHGKEKVLEYIEGPTVRYAIPA